MDGYAFEAAITEVVPFGLVPEGLRIDGHFQGRVTEGPLAGDTVTGIDHLLLRRDGVGVMDIRMVARSAAGRAVSWYAGGYLTLQGEVPPLEVLGDPGFVWPDRESPMHGWATMRSAAPELRAVNSTVYGFTGTNNVARGQLRVRGQSLARVLVG
jgi:hypothetical protein